VKYNYIENNFNYYYNQLIIIHISERENLWGPARKIKYCVPLFEEKDNLISEF
jgi:hypothetical protein